MKSMCLPNVEALRFKRKVSEFQSPLCMVAERLINPRAQDFRPCLSHRLGRGQHFCLLNLAGVTSGHFQLQCFGRVFLTCDLLDFQRTYNWHCW